jgi:hypothetical protein
VTPRSASEVRKQPNDDSKEHEVRHPPRARRPHSGQPGGAPLDRMSCLVPFPAHDRHSAGDESTGGLDGPALHCLCALRPVDVVVVAAVEPTRPHTDSCRHLMELTCCVSDHVTHQPTPERHSHVIHVHRHHRSPAISARPASCAAVKASPINLARSRVPIRG